MGRITNRVSSRIWTGQTGVALRSEPLEVRTVQWWLFTHDKALAEPYGLYLCEPDVAVSHIGAKLITEARVEMALQRLTQIGFCHYDPVSRYVWIVEMARWQLLINDQPLKVQDWKAIAAARWYASVHDNPWLGPFWDRYNRDLKLGPRRQGRVEERGSSLKISTQSVFDLIGEEGGAGEETPPPPAARKTKRELDAEIDVQLWPLFTEWWALYPVKSGKQDAFKAYREEKPPQEKLLATTRAYLTSREWAERPNGERAIPYPATFIRGHRWDDEPTPQRQKRGAVGTTEYAARANGWREQCPHRPTCKTPTECQMKQIKEENNRDAAITEEPPGSDDRRAHQLDR